MACRSFILWPGCWVYLKAPEQKTLTEVLKVLKARKSMSQNYIQQQTGITRESIRKALDLLMIIRAVKVQQRKDARIYSVVRGWRSKLDKALAPYDKYKNDVHS